MSMRYQFRAGGNPPVSPGLFLKDDAQPSSWKRIAWWPATRSHPDQTSASLVLIAYEDKGSALTRSEVEALIEP
jgi:hypothetical protein